MKKIFLVLASLFVGVSLATVPALADSSINSVNKSNIRDEIVKNLPRSEKDDNSLRMKFKTDGFTLKIYKIEGYRTYEYISDYYIAILKSLQKSNLDDYQKIIIDSEYDQFTFDKNTIKTLPLSQKAIKNLGFEDDDEANYDDYVDNYLKSKAISYKDKCETDDE